MIKGLNIVAKRKPGRPVRWYVYAWRGGPCIMTQDGGSRPVKLTPDAVLSYNQALEDARRDPAHTFGRLVQDWRASSEWSQLGEKTRYEWGRMLDLLPERWRSVPLEVFEDRRAKGKVTAWRDDLAGRDESGQPKHRRKADYAVGVLKQLLEWGRSRGRIGVNIAEGIPTLWKGGKRATIIWEVHEREAMQQAPQHIRDAFNLACLTGLRRSDLCELPLAAAGEHAIVWHPAKGEEHERVVTVPMIAPLAALVDDLRSRKRKPGVQTMLVNSRGQAWTPDGLEASFIKAKKKLGIDKHLHDCRGSFATELCMAGLTDDQVAGIMGWSPTTVADLRRIYVDQARTVVAIGERLAAASANRSANQSSDSHAK